MTERALPEGLIPLTPIAAPPSPEVEPHRLFILGSVSIAVLGGFLLAVVIPLSRALGLGLEISRPDAVQVHGQLQLLGFAGLFVMGMALRLLPRFSRARLRWQGLIAPVWGLTVGGLALRALVIVWLPDDLHSAFMIGFEAVMLAAGAAFAAVVAGTLLTRPNQADATGWFFVGGALFAVLQGLTGLLIAVEEVHDPTRVFSFLPDAALLDLQLDGFLLCFIAGVAGRALPTMVGLDRSIGLGKAVAVLLTASVTALAGALLWLEYREYTPAAVRVAGAALSCAGLVFLAVVWLSGVFRPVADRLRPASRPHFWLVRCAFAWLCFAAGLALFYGVDGFIAPGLPGPFQLDAIRHSLAAGLVTNLIAGMAQMIVPEFAGERFEHPEQARRSRVLLVLINAAAVLRVAPALAGLSWTAAARSWSMAAAGLCAEAALLVFALAFIRLARRGPA